MIEDKIIKMQDQIDGSPDIRQFITILNNKIDAVKMANHFRQKEFDCEVLTKFYYGIPMFQLTITRK